MLNYPRLTPAFIIGFVVLFAIGLGKLDGRAKITDPFHQGEYFASFASMFNHQASQNYLTILGALDYIPAGLSFNTYGSTHYFLAQYFYMRWLRYCLLFCFIYLSLSSLIDLHHITKP